MEAAFVLHRRDKDHNNHTNHHKFFNYRNSTLFWIWTP